MRCGVLREVGERSLWASQARLTFWPLDTGMLVVAEEEAFSAVALIAAHRVDTALLTATIALSTLVHICARQVIGGAMASRPGPQH